MKLCSLEHTSFHIYMFVGYTPNTKASRDVAELQLYNQ